jgi:hypothetical protein
LDEHGEDFDRLIPQAHPDTAIAQFPRPEIQFERPEFDNGAHVT